MTMPPSGQWPPPSPGPGQQPPSWGQQPPLGRPQRGGNRGRWILGGIALAVVVGLTVVATLLVNSAGSGDTGDPLTSSSPAPTASIDPSGIASADDDGPVEIITDEPTCATWAPINDTYVASLGNWVNRDPSVPRSEWTSEQRSNYETAASVMSAAANQTVPLAKLTPHRVVRELYEQSIAYWRAYAESIQDYEPADDHLALVATSTANTVVNICSAITYGSAAARKPLIFGGDITPRELAPLQNPASPSQFLEEPLAVCAEWLDAVDRFNDATAEWIAVDGNIPASQWSPDQRRIYATVTAVMSRHANRIQTIGITSGNAVFADFSALAAQYLRAYVQAIPNYSPSDNDLATVASQVGAANTQACAAAKA